MNVLLFLSVFDCFIRWTEKRIDGVKIYKWYIMATAPAPVHTAVHSLSMLIHTGPPAVIPHASPVWGLLEAHQVGDDLEREYFERKHPAVYCFFAATLVA